MCGQIYFTGVKSDEFGVRFSSLFQIIICWHTTRRFLSVVRDIEKYDIDA
jgi:hypothetical protein